jgi:hypothetical protein
MEWKREPLGLSSLGLALISNAPILDRILQNFQQGLFPRRHCVVGEVIDSSFQGSGKLPQL